jgi:hypothetical protein
MMLVIATQDYENYAAHQGFTGEYRWKAKGGSEYKITNIPANTDPAEIVELVRGEIEQDNEYFQTTILGYSIQPDDYLSWFEKSQMDYEGSIQFAEPSIEYNEIKGVTA